MSIKRHLLEAVVAKKEALKSAVSLCPEQVEEKLKNLWVQCIPEGVPERVAGVDGSRNSANFAGYTIYAVGAGCVLYEGQGAPEETFLCDIGLLRGEKHPESRLHILMATLEFKVALKVCERVNCLLVDGSIVNAILKPTALTYQLEKQERVRLEEAFWGKVVPNYTLNSLTSRELGFEEAYMEYLEYLYTLLKLLRTCGKKLVAVSKTSDSRAYALHEKLPDITVLNRLTLKPGYTKPIACALTQQKKFSLPEPFDRELRSYTFNTFFYRLKGNALKVETLMQPEKALKVLAYYSVGGYPYPLAQAHRSVKITAKDMSTLISIVGLADKTGREFLGEA